MNPSELTPATQTGFVDGKAQSAHNRLRADIEAEELPEMPVATDIRMVILAIAFWYWMWGVLGVILEMPMLAITKIICDRIQPLNAFGHFIEG